MTANGNLKRRVRARAAKTGESYTTALRHFRASPRGEQMPEFESLRIAVAQTTVRDDPTSGAELVASGQQIREVMHLAHEAGARLLHLTEGATCFPSKYVMSSEGPDRVGPADWSRFDWEVLDRELAQITALAGRLRLWTVVGSVHRLGDGRRPHNSLYVVSDAGRVVARYDERTLSQTKRTYMYTPGTDPVTVEVDGVRFGCALGMDSHFTEVFGEYDRLEVDAVLISTTGTVPNDTVVGAEALGHAATHGYWTILSVPAQHSPVVPSGIVRPSGEWAARCPADGSTAIATAELEPSDRLLRSWRRDTRAALFDG